jgi:hypothetical protein
MRKLAIIALVLALASPAGALTFNGTPPQGAGSGSDTLVGTTPIKVLTCGQTLYSGAGNTQYIDFQTSGGVAGTDYCRIIATGGCGNTPLPAPSIANRVGYVLASGGVVPSHQPINFPSAPGNAASNISTTDWWGVCSSAGMFIGTTTLP